MNLELISIALSQYGLKEMPGVADNPVILQMAKECGFKDYDHDSTSWCLGGDMEIMTSEGWKRFDELDGSEIVAQIHPEELSMSFVKPIAFIKKEHNDYVYRVSNKNFDFICDQTHEFFGRWDAEGLQGENFGNFKKKTLDKVISGLSIPVIKSGQEDNSKFSDLDLEFLAAFLSDGSAKSIKDNKIQIVQFNLSKERKIKKVKDFNPHREYVKEKLYGLNKVYSTVFYCRWPAHLNEIFDGYKILKWDFIFSLSKRQLDVFLDAYLIFDGNHHEKTNVHTFYTISEFLRDQLITMISLAGYRAFLNVSSNIESSFPSENLLYRINYTKRRKGFFLKRKDINYEKFNGFLYCVTVPTGLIYVRDKNMSPFVTGNCSMFTNWSAFKSGYQRSNSLAARSWLTVGHSVETPEPGDVVVLWRESPQSWMGHVGFFIRIVGNYVYMLGGNQGDMVNIEAFDKNRVLDYRRLEKI